MRDTSILWWAASASSAVLIYALGPTRRAVWVSALVTSAAVGAIALSIRGPMAAPWPCVFAVIIFWLLYVAAAGLSAAIATVWTGRTPKAFVGMAPWWWEASPEELIATVIWGVLGCLGIAVSVDVFEQLVP